MADIDRLVKSFKEAALEKERLLAGFLEFRQALAKRLDSWLTEAIDKGLADATHLKQRGTGDEYQVTFSMAGLDLELVSDTTVHPISFGGPLAAKAFVYVAYGEDEPPLIEISCVGGGGGYALHVSKLFDDHWIPLGTPIPLEAEDAAERVVNWIADHLYSLRFMWRKVVIRGSAGHPKLSIGGFQAEIATG